ncbi:ELWxxDGT repeat protein, partial [Candidatus Magnetaquicoccus inordinatus]|uniref:ELWxxDGT repeat protein n=1 Tax=Candidatus Magnetaquicoccus inordinatus TaxID=2496818 RepID=UPI00102B43F5
ASNHASSAAEGEAASSGHSSLPNAPVVAVAADTAGDTSCRVAATELPTPSATAPHATRLLILSSDIAQDKLLAEAVKEGVTVVRYDGQVDDSHSLLQKVDTALAGGQAESIAFASHASAAGTLHLAAKLPINRYTLAYDSDSRAFWQQIGQKLTADGRIDLLGCSLVATPQGEELTHLIAAISGHQVAASTDATGNPASGGDWLLEQGQIDVAASYFDATRLAKLSGQLGYSRGIYVTNSSGTDATLVKEIVPGGDPYIYRMVTLNGKAYFFAETENEGRELWVSDGTSAGTQLLVDINPGEDSSSYGYVTEMVLCNNKIYFQADDGINGEELWQTDGTAAGTVMVKDIWSGIAGSDILNITVFGNKIFFHAKDGSGDFGSHNQLWMSDGTAAGTQLVKDFGYNGMRYDMGDATIAATSDAVYFLGKYGSNYEQLWKTTDGTAANTTLVKNLGSNAGDGIYWEVEEGRRREMYGPSLVAVDNKLYFDAYTSALGVEAWVSDGTSAGTFNLTNDGSTSLPSNGGFFSSISPVSGFVKFNGLVYFSYFDKLYKTDGTSANTSRVNGIESVAVYHPMGNILYITGSTATSGPPNYELLSYDGTTVSTVIDLTNDPPGSISVPVAVIGDKLYFTPWNESTYGAELWVSDGTAIGTHLVKDIFLGSESSSPRAATELNGILIFTAETFVNEAPVFSQSGAGTLSVASNSREVNINEYLQVDDWDDDQTLTWSQSVAPAHGNLTFIDASADSGDSELTPYGSVSYTPNGGYVGADSFVIQVSDGIDSVTRTINLTVVNNTNPLYVQSTTQVISMSINSTQIDLGSYLHVNDPDSEQTLTWSGQGSTEMGYLDISSATASSGGTDIAPPEGSIIYTPYSSEDSDHFSVQVSDGISTVTRNFTIHFVSAVELQIEPLADLTFFDTAAHDIFIQDGGILQVSNLDYEQDIDAGIIDATMRQGAMSVKVGNYGYFFVSLYSTQYFFLPDPTTYFPGHDVHDVNSLTSDFSESFTVYVTNGNNTSSATCTVHFKGVNDTPELATPEEASYSVQSANDSFLNATGQLAGSDRDSGQTLTYGLQNGSTADGQTIAGTAYDLGKGGLYGKLFISTADGKYLYMPDTAALRALRGVATETFTVTVTDSILTSTATFTVHLQGREEGGTPEGESVIPVKTFLPTASESAPTPSPGSEWNSKESSKDSLEEFAAAPGVTIIRDKPGGVAQGKSNVIIGAHPVTVIRGTPEIGATPVTVIRESNPQEASPASSLQSATASTGNNFSTVLAALPNTASPFAVESAVRLPSAVAANEGGLRFSSEGRGDNRSEALIANNLPAQVQPRADGSIQFQLGADSFGHSDGNAKLQLAAVQANGEPLPSWITFDAKSGTFSGQPPAGSNADLTITVTAKDSQGREATLTLQIKMGDGNNKAAPGDQPGQENKPQSYWKSLYHERDLARLQQQWEGQNPASGKPLPVGRLSEQMRAAQRAGQLQAQARLFYSADRALRRA